MPPAAVTLGWEAVDVDSGAGTLDLPFDAGERFGNPAMPDDTAGPAPVAALPLLRRRACAPLPAA
ncbi:hypothetical protein ACFQZ2_04090 [Streptomonospora algeriensis]|uniref:Uncharacterized protein n=1 Tax=Streptomonospora algeriensis TaxID=995084 RepID=A0ABW3BC39_9ACTN